jgi:hypothetical protein
MIFTGSGDEFMMDADPEGFKLEAGDLPYWAYEYAYKDGRALPSVTDFAVVRSQKGSLFFRSAM